MMAKHLIFILFLFALCNIVSLKAMTSILPVDTIPPEDIFVMVEKMPSFPDGKTAMLQYIKDNLQYPVEAKAANIQGTVYVKFVVLKDGSLYDIKIVRGVANGFGVNKEALRLVQSMPKWTPGTQRGVPVAVYYTLPIRFKMGLPLKPEPVKPTNTTKPQKPMIQSKQLVPMNKRAKELKSKQKIKMNMQITPKHPSTKAPDIVEGEGIEFDKVGADGVPVYKTVPEMPYYGKEETEMFKFIEQNLNYPPKAKKSKIQGTTYVGFTVMEDGELKQIHIKKGIAGGEMCDEEALRVVRLFPNWQSGKIAGEAVRVSYVLPVRYKILGGGKNWNKRNKWKK
ncbi:MAG: energy transducer TonB [Chitinophagales bacterium]